MEHWKVKKLKELKKGEFIITSEKGNSMTPLFMSGEKHKLTPITLDECNVGDAVFCKVKGNYYTHLVLSKDNKRGALIGNAHGKVNGWTRNVYGKAFKIR